MGLVGRKREGLPLVRAVDDGVRSACHPNDPHLAHTQQMNVEVAKSCIRSCKNGVCRAQNQSKACRKLTTLYTTSYMPAAELAEPQVQKPATVIACATEIQGPPTPEASQS